MSAKPWRVSRFLSCIRPQAAAGILLCDGTSNAESVQLWAISLHEAEVFGSHFVHLSPSSNGLGLVTAPPFRKHFLTSHQQFLLLLLVPAGAGCITLKGDQETNKITNSFASCCLSPSCSV